MYPKIKNIIFNNKNNINYCNYKILKKVKNKFHQVWIRNKKCN